jgi:hypothetical protein
MLIDVAVPGDRNVIKKEAEKIIKYKKPLNRNSTHVECETKSDTDKNMGECNHFKITQTKPAPSTRKVQN